MCTSASARFLSSNTSKCTNIQTQQKLLTQKKTRCIMNPCHTHRRYGAKQQTLKLRQTPTLEFAALKVPPQLAAHQRTRKKVYRLPTIMHDHMLVRRAARWAWLTQEAALRRRRLARFQRRRRRQLRRHRKRGPAARGEGERTVRSAQGRASSSSARAYLGNGARLSGEGQTAGRMADGEARSRSPALPGW